MITKLLYTVILKEQVILAVGAASSRNLLIRGWPATSSAESKPLPKGLFNFTWIFRISALLKKQN